MKPCLADVNVVLALVAQPHVRHLTVARWYDGLSIGEFGICRPVQLSVVRLLCNPAIMGNQTLTAWEGWRVIQELQEDERTVFLEEPDSFEVVFPELLGDALPSAKLVPDAYLAAVAIAGSYPLVTFDRDFLRFRALNLRLMR
jgi:uncharacterized protein